MRILSLLGLLYLADLLLFLLMLLSKSSSPRRIIGLLITYPSSNHVLATSYPPPLPPIAAFTAPLWINSRCPTSQSSKGSCCEFCHAKGHDISICHKLQKFMQEQNKAPLLQVAVVCPSDQSVPTGPSLVSSLTTANIEAVVQ